METKAIHPIAATVIIVVVVAIAAFVVWRMASPPSYNGPPINMGAQMRQPAVPPGGGGTSR